jgi:hypothetical protein
MAPELLLDGHFSALESEHINLAVVWQSYEGLSDLLKLLSDNGQYLNIDTIELIEAGPAALLAEA